MVSVGYMYSGITKLASTSGLDGAALELLFAPLGLSGHLTESEPQRLNGSGTEMESWCDMAAVLRRAAENEA